MAQKLIKRLFSGKKEEVKMGRSPSGKPKHSKVAKMIKLAKARSKKKVKAKKTVKKNSKKKSKK